MLDEGAEQAPIDAADGKDSIERDSGLPHRAGSNSEFGGRMRRGAVACNGRIDDGLSFGEPSILLRATADLDGSRAANDTATGPSSCG
jgi:hypothetical protein